jgi:hypothetical protein
MSLLGLEESTLTLDSLYSRRHVALTGFEVHAAKQIEALERRIASGEKRIHEEEARHQAIAVEAAGEHWQQIDRAKLKLVALQDELQQLRLGWEVPTQIFDALYSLVEWTVKRDLPEGSLLTVAIPGVLHITVDLTDDHLVPF